MVRLAEIVLRRFEMTRGDPLLAELSDAERATRLIGPPLASRAEPSRPDVPNFGG